MPRTMPWEASPRASPRAGKRVRIMVMEGGEPERPKDPQKDEKDPEAAQALLPERISQHLAKGLSMNVVGMLMFLEALAFASAAGIYHSAPSLQPAVDARFDWLVGHLVPGSLGANLRRQSAQLREQERDLRKELLQLQQMNDALHRKCRRLGEEMDSDVRGWRVTQVRRLQEENHWLKHRMQAQQPQTHNHPFEAVTGSPGHQLPEMYGHVREKTIWAYWYNAEDCATAANCRLPPEVKLCTETVERHKGSFDYRIVRRDEIDRYVNRFELPIHWEQLRPALQKDALMNALLARYGGVALDISTVLFRPLDDLWEEMVAKGASFRGYMYRLNGQPWFNAESTAVWFLMARREGLFSVAARNQVIGMGDMINTRAYSAWYFALGDQTLLPILTMFNYSLPRCVDDDTVHHHWACPEHELPEWTDVLIEPRNDTRIMLEDPRDGPQLPFAFAGMEVWEVTNDTSPVHPDNNGPGFPMHKVGCDSMKTCWEDVFLPRYRGAAAAGGRPLHFVKLFQAGHDLLGSSQKGRKVPPKSRQEILSNRKTYFHNWLRLAGLPDFQ